MLDNTYLVIKSEHSQTGWNSVWNCPEFTSKEIYCQTLAKSIGTKWPNIGKILGTSASYEVSFYISFLFINIHLISFGQYLIRICTLSEQNHSEFEKSCLVKYMLF